MEKTKEESQGKTRKGERQRDRERKRERDGQSNSWIEKERWREKAIRYVAGFKSDLLISGYFVCFQHS